MCIEKDDFICVREAQVKLRKEEAERKKEREERVECAQYLNDERFQLHFICVYGSQTCERVRYFFVPFFVSESVYPLIQSRRISFTRFLTTFFAHMLRYITICLRINTHSHCILLFLLFIC